ncbi:hypothetical protein MHBO_001149 [Bonamia ostreae]|uniref:RRM domain-containing protein n=1 Tax=Bonamia ostreae TaxID=126728 RepID=A0ABV2AHY4_9EUKA
MESTVGNKEMPKTQNNQNSQNTAKDQLNKKSLSISKNKPEKQNAPAITAKNATSIVSENIVDDLFFLASDVEKSEFMRRSALEFPNSQSLKVLISKLDRNPDLRKIYVKTFGLKKEAEEDLKTAFSRFGSVSNVKIVINQQTGELRGYAFVGFESVLSALNALEQRHVTVKGITTVNSTFKRNTLKQFPGRDFDGGFAQNQRAPNMQNNMSGPGGHPNPYFGGQWNGDQRAFGQSGNFGQGFNSQSQSGPRV